jgi:hypothetical protein
MKGFGHRPQGGCKRGCVPITQLSGWRYNVVGRFIEFLPPTAPIESGIPRWHLATTTERLGARPWVAIVRNGTALILLQRCRFERGFLFDTLSSPSLADMPGETNGVVVSWAVAGAMVM